MGTGVPYGEAGRPLSKNYLKTVHNQLSAIFNHAIRYGELLALTAADFNFEKSTVSINKSYQRIGKEDIITAPKTPKSIRVIQMPHTSIITAATILQNSSMKMLTKRRLKSQAESNISSRQ